MEKGTLVEFRTSNGDRRVAVVERPEGKKHWVVVDERGQSHTLHPRQIIYEVTGESYSPTQIPAFITEIQPYLDPSSLEVAWEFLVEEGVSTDPTEMAILLFSEQSPSLCYAAHCLLADDKIYFKQKGDRYEPRSVAQVAELKHQLTVSEQRAQEWQAFVSRVQQALNGDSVEWQSSDRPRLDVLERLAVFGDEATGRVQAAEILQAVGRSDSAEAAFQLLVDLRLWSPHENLFLRRSQIPVQFSQRVLEMTHRCVVSPNPDPDNRLDLTYLKTYTIDDESTLEIDDGLSIEYLDDGRQRLWIHIADPTRWVAPNDDLDMEARRRCTTIYLPTGMIPMFPPELATGPMSLVQRQICCALSFGIILNDEGAVEDYHIQASHVKPTYRLTYEDVDEMLEMGLEAESEIQAIAEWAKVRQAWRQSRGAISIHMPESSIKVDGDDITIDVLDDSVSRMLVAEMMILAGEVAGLYGQTHGLPLPFRGQPQPELPPDEELMLLPVGPVRDCAIRRCMPRSETTVVPARHASLALDVYTQVTSPIRRYADLLAHFQIKAHLRGESLPFSTEDVQELMLSVSSTAYEASQVERQTNRYWGLEYLRRQGDAVWHALMLRWLREQDNLGLVLLEDLGLELAMRFTRPIAPGDRLEVKVSYADPRRDIIQFTEMATQVV
ncbi:MAG: VacB/RNase II family 3'-5' exoribonuclease [Synechococcales cyanobacterium T60_A2020_003]|nr:VacB/RNase II family 3'-5' exoribonuclease [Synechococcales cyanobacterium T60_A2020_003]